MTTTPTPTPDPGSSAAGFATPAGAAPAAHVLFIDNFDSFTFNLVDELARRGAQVHTWRNDVDATDALAVARELPSPRLIVLSPGPGAPGDAGCCVELVRLVARDASIPLLGICLGHQAIVEALGGTVGPAGEIVHGKTSRVQHDGQGLFTRLPNPMTVGRYHSLAAQTLPDSLDVVARFGELTMAVRHRTAPIAGLQFHPESILTPQGGLLLENALRWAADIDGPGEVAHPVLPEHHDERTET